jgi:hypothetical protein
MINTGREASPEMQSLQVVRAGAAAVSWPRRHSTSDGHRLPGKIIFSRCLGGC